MTKKTSAPSKGKSLAKEGNQARWWNDYKLENKSSLFFTLGELMLSIQPLENETHISYEYRTKDEEDYHLPRIENSLRELKAVERFVINKSNDQIRLLPQLADRPVVARPKNNLYLLPNQSTTLYVSSAIWLAIFIAQGKEPAKELRSIALSDTWMGASTREGEICYAARTSGKISLDQIIHLPYRAVTPVKLKNSGKDVLAIERIALPTPHLNLYEDENANLWTNTVSIDRIHNKDNVSLKLEPKPPEHVKDVKLICKSREPASDNKLSKTIKLLLG